MTISCELCGKESFIKRDGFFECEYCKVKYTLEEVQKLIQANSRDNSLNISEIQNTEDKKSVSIGIEIQNNKCKGYTSVVTQYTNDSTKILGLIKQDLVSKNEFEDLNKLLINSVKKIYEYEDSISLITMVVPCDFTFEQRKYIDSFFSELKIAFLFLGRCNAIAHKMFSSEDDECIALFVDVCSTGCEIEVIEISDGILEVLSHSIINDYKCSIYTFEEVWKNIGLEIKNTIKETGHEPDSIDEIIWSGDISENSCFLDSNNIFNNKMKVIPNNYVAHGAAIYSACKNLELKNLLLWDITPYSIGFKANNSEFVPVIKKNVTIPTKKDIVYSVPVNNVQQVNLDISVCIENNTFTKEDMLLGKIHFSEVSYSNIFASSSSVQISFDLNNNGDLKVSIYFNNLSEKYSKTYSFKIFL